MTRRPVLLLSLLVAAHCAAQPAAHVKVHPIKSKNLGGAETSIHVLLPTTFDPAMRYPVRQGLGKERRKKKFLAVYSDDVGDGEYSCRGNHVC